MKKIIFLFMTASLLSCGDDGFEANIEEDPVYTTVSGNIYRAESVSSWDYGNFLIYKMSLDSTIIVEKRKGSFTGEIVKSTIGYYKYFHPKLELKINSGCENCFNYFTATVKDDRKSFSYEIWDMMEGKTKELKFVIQPDK